MLNTEYLFVIFFLLVGFCISLLLLLLAYCLAPKYFDLEKISVYECGFQPFYNSRMPFDVHFYIIAILFLIFDVEIAFIYPWVTISFYNGVIGFCILLLFIFILAIGFIYEWKKNVLDWTT